MKNRFALHSKKGFALAEVIVATFFVTLVIFLVASLGKQVGLLNSKARQSGTILELRGSFGLMQRDPGAWMDKARGASDMASMINACMPDASSATSQFTCPAVIPPSQLLVDDPLLAERVGTRFASSVPVTNFENERVAGTLDNPVYRTLDGQHCAPADLIGSNCPLKSTGYLLRQNENVENLGPGNVGFLVKVERNLASSQGRDLPMRPQFMAMDLGMEWRDGGEGSSCPAGTVKLGTFSSGQPYCVNITTPCPSNEVAIGVQSNGRPVCSTIPPNCAGGVRLNAEATPPALECSTETEFPCEPGNVFLGYYSGQPDPICISPSRSCANGQIQVGYENTGLNPGPVCAAVTACDPNMRLSYDGTQFECVKYNNNGCEFPKVVVGLNDDLSPICEVPQRLPASCAVPGEFLKEIKADGTIVCEAPGGGANTTTTTSGGGTVEDMSCPAGQYVHRFVGNVPQCAMLPGHPISCKDYSTNNILGLGTPRNIPLSCDPGCYVKSFYGYGGEKDSAGSKCTGRSPREISVFYVDYVRLDDANTNFTTTRFKNVRKDDVGCKNGVNCHVTGEAADGMFPQSITVGFKKQTDVEDDCYPNYVNIDCEPVR